VKAMRTLFLNIFLFILYFFAIGQNANEHIEQIISPDVVSSDCECKNEKTIKNLHNLEGYSDKISYHPGETVNLYIHTLNFHLTVDFIKNDIEDTLIKKVKNVCVKRQNYTTCSYKYGCNWDPNLCFKLDEKLNSGFYKFKLYSGNDTYIMPIIIAPNEGSNNPILLIASTNTWQAYNEWGGASFYRFYNENDCNLKYAQILSTQRPSNIAYTPIEQGHEYNAELLFINWLIKNNYNFDVMSDDDLDNNQINLNQYKAFIISTHSEYWTQNMYNNLDKYINNKGNVLSLGANQVYWKVIRKDDKIECRKDGSIHTIKDEFGGRWRDIGKHESAILGVEFSVKGAGTYSYYKVQDYSHWVFENTNLSNGDSIGYYSLTGKDSTGASGLETDKMTTFSPSNTILLAKGQNPSKVGLTDFGAGGAEMTLYEHPSGGAVFSAGSISYIGSLALDRSISKITKNVLDNFLRR
jgi:hypothetical protein